MSTAAPKLVGYWVQDKERSDKDDASFALIEAGFMLRKGIHAVRGLEIEISPGDYFQFALVTIVPFFKIKEKYPLSGETVEQKRRDMRSGKHKGRVTLAESGDQAQIHFEFEGELAGTGHDRFQLVNDDELHIIHTLENQNGKNVATKIYNRKR